LEKRVVAYHIDRKYVDDHHSLVLLTVVGEFSIPTVLPTSWFIEGKRLSRLSPVFGDFAVLDVMTDKGVRRSVAVLGDSTSVTLPMAQFDAIHAVALVAKVPITPAMVASNILPNDGAGLPTEKMLPGHAAILAGFIRAGIPPSPPIVYPPSSALLPVTFGRHDYTAPVPLKAFGSPLIGPCYAYAAGIMSDNACIKGRVEKFHKLDNAPIPPTLAGYMVEFAERLIPVPGIGHPVGHDEVRDKQDRPSQRVLLDEAAVTGNFVKKIWRAFVKKETSVKVSDPRNISMAAPSVKLEYSTFMYSFHEGVMAAMEW
jgi:hypothetical protein